MSTWKNQRDGKFSRDTYFSASARDRNLGETMVVATSFRHMLHLQEKSDMKRAS